MSEVLKKALEDGVIRYAYVTEIAAKLSVEFGLEGREKIYRARKLEGKLLTWNNKNVENAQEIAEHMAAYNEGVMVETIAS